MHKRLLILNGPNLNLLGEREPGLYGSLSLAAIEELSVKTASALGWQTRCKQSNYEGGLVEAIHDARHDCDGVVINAGAYTHTSVAIHDAFRGSKLPFIEVHISNVFARESFRHHSYLSEIAEGVICGFGAQSYVLGIQGLINKLNEN